MKSKIIGIAGASGSGKSFFAEKLGENLQDKSICILSQDFYYKEHSTLSLEERRHLNFDHPDAIDFHLLEEHLRQLKAGKSISHPQYDFTVHNRKSEWVTVEPTDIVLVDGILIYAVPEVLPLFDVKVFIHTPKDIAFIRRLERDLHARGRSVESVIKQYLNTVRPMLLQFVAPCEEKADVVFEGRGDMQKEAERVINMLDALL